MTRAPKARVTSLRDATGRALTGRPVVFSFLSASGGLLGEGLRLLLLLGVVLGLLKLALVGHERLVDRQRGDRPARRGGNAELRARDDVAGREDVVARRVVG